MNFIVPLLIALAGIESPVESRYPDTTEVFRCDFGKDWDKNYDGWPDDWTRRRGRGYPHYVSMHIDADSPPPGGSCLRVELDGGAAAAYSPIIEVSPLFAFVLDVFVKTEGLKHDRVHLSLTFLDRDRKKVESFDSRKIRATGGWMKLRLGPVMPKSGEARQAVIGLHVEPTAREDLTGEVAFGDVWLGRLLRTSLKTENQGNLFFNPDDVQITCNASGFTDEQLEVTFQLEDVLGNVLTEAKRPFLVRSMDQNAVLSLDAFVDQPNGFQGKASWVPEIPGPGFYRVRSMIAGDGGFVHRRELTLAVVTPRHSQPGGEFGWTLPGGNKPLSLPALSQLLGQSGVNWAKYPLWFDESGGEPTIEQLVDFSERLTAQDIEMVGLLCVPPEGLRKKFGEVNSLSAADIFRTGPNVWYPSLEPVLTRFVTLIRWWQLGNDVDTSFVDYPQLHEKILEIRTKLDRFAQDVNLVIGWDWMRELPAATPPASESDRFGSSKTVSSGSARSGPGAAVSGRGAPWRGLTISANPSMTPEELARYLKATSDYKTHRWVVVEPLSKTHYPLEIRAADLVRRMIAAKLHGADAVFCPQPFDDQRGLMNADGTPAELFMPWRTTALALGGAKYIGSIELPFGSPNLIFAHYDEAVMVVWNDDPREEVMYLGEDVRQTDIWGNERRPETRGHRQVIEVGRLPTFVGPIDLPVARWRMDVQLRQNRIPSIAGVKHENSLSLQNHFGDGVSGRVEMLFPESWTVDPRDGRFRLAADERIDLPTSITLPFGAESGRHLIRFDFHIGPAGKKKFSAYREMQIGMGGVLIDIQTRLNGQGQLEVLQTFINNTAAEVNFRCQLFAPNRRRLRTQIIGLKSSEDTQVYVLEDGRELIGETLWLSAEEMNGRRVLNYHFIARP